MSFNNNINNISQNWYSHPSLLAETTNRELNTQQSVKDINQLKAENQQLIEDKRKLEDQNRALSVQLELLYKAFFLLEKPNNQAFQMMDLLSENCTNLEKKEPVKAADNRRSYQRREQISNNSSQLDKLSKENSELQMKNDSLKKEKEQLCISNHGLQKTNELLSLEKYWMNAHQEQLCNQNTS